MPDDSTTDSQSKLNIIRTVQTPLGFFTLVILVVEGILGLLASKASDSNFTLLLAGMISLLFLLVLIVAFIAYKNPDALTGDGEKDSEGVVPAGLRRGECAEFMKAILPDNITNAIEHEARHHKLDHIRIACAHTVWSCRPDRAKPILEDASRDWSEVVRTHARGLLNRFY